MKKVKRIFIFGKVPLNDLSEEDFYDVVYKWIEKKKKKKIFYLNVHNVVSATKDNKYLNALNDSDMIYPDGWGPIFAAQVLYNIKKKRINAADIIDDIFKKINQKKVKIYLLGDEQKVVKIAAEKISSKYPKIKIVGYHNGFFNNKTQGKIIKEINKLKPNLVLIGMGTPKQELWVSDNFSKLPNAVYWCVGGLFNYIAGLRQRAPLWMRKNSLEWLFRLFQEPRRLYIRYSYENIIFAYMLLLSFVKKIFIKSDSST